jgi:hypothetical protein
MKSFWGKSFSDWLSAQSVTLLPWLLNNANYR